MTSKIIEIALLLIIPLVVIGIHELGHLITGVYLGFRLELFILGPLGIKRDEDKIKIYFNKNIAHYGGITSTIPRKDSPENNRKFALILLAGPITSLFLSIFLGALYYTLEFQFSKFLLIGSLTSLGIFLVTTIPNKTGMFFTDRKRYQRLTKDGPEKDVELALLRIIGNYGKDNSYKNVNPNDIELVIQDKDYKYFGLFTKLTYEHETTGKFDLTTKREFEKKSNEMPKSSVKAMRMQLEKL
ncbi:M50 family metallopeptidase [Salegentibacter sp. Hel_I_6]|uniref:M50 family metallopeptidase n=1 Tax=Salegentibacter sp. Hel_I_6 TaxID=1250278 RepID=UPI00055C1362|nr:M50 family metallopeptidase [Salegentibacter sp. Hel_I_6]